MLTGGAGAPRRGHADGKSRLPLPLPAARLMQLLKTTRKVSSMEMIKASQLRERMMILYTLQTERKRHEQMLSASLMRYPRQPSAMQCTL